MWKKIDMVVCHLESSSQKAMEFQSKLKTYWKHVQRFTQYCHQRNFNPFQVITKIGIEYLTEYFHTGVGYSSVNTAKSVLSTMTKIENEIPFRIFTCNIRNKDFLRKALKIVSDKLTLPKKLLYFNEIYLFIYFLT